MVDALFENGVLNGLRVYRDSMTEFDIEEMDYLINLVERDIELKDF